MFFHLSKHVGSIKEGKGFTMDFYYVNPEKVLILYMYVEMLTIIGTKVNILYLICKESFLSTKLYTLNGTAFCYKAKANHLIKHCHSMGSAKHKTYSYGHSNSANDRTSTWMLD